MDYRESVCRIEAKGHNGHTVISDRFYTSPFKVMNPFSNGKKAEIVIMTASAGVLANDHYVQNYQVKENGDLKITGQGYTKVFNTRNDCCTQRINLKATGKSTLRYMQKPVIPFRGSTYYCNTTAEIDADSRLVFQDIVACGRVGYGERFQMRQYRSRLEVWKEGKLIFLDNCLLDPNRYDYTSVGFFDKYTHMGMMYIYLPSGLGELKENFRTLPFAGRFGITNAREGILVRALADQGDDIERLFIEMNRMVE